MDNFIEAASKEGIKIESDYRLADLTTWKIGGNAKYFVKISDLAPLKIVVKLASENGVPYHVIGLGSNILISDNGYEGLVIKNLLSKIKISGERVIAESGVPMGKLAAMTMQANLSGLEWAVGIPGTVGGAIYGNSNCFGASTSDKVETVDLLQPDGDVRMYPKSFFNFDYDYSSIQNSTLVVVSAIFRLQMTTHENMLKIRNTIAATAAYRAKNQPLGASTAGSTFKALKIDESLVKTLEEEGFSNWREGIRDGMVSAGYIIDKCLNLKGYTLDKMMISDLHANFFLNQGGATAKNAKQLIDYVKKECKNKLDINLTEEIQYLGKF